MTTTRYLVFGFSGGSAMIAFPLGTGTPGWRPTAVETPVPPTSRTIVGGWSTYSGVPPAHELILRMPLLRSYRNTLPEWWKP